MQGQAPRLPWARRHGITRTDAGARPYGNRTLPFKPRYLMPVRHFPNKTGGMSLPLRTVDLPSLQRHTASPPEVTSLIANWYHNARRRGRNRTVIIMGNSPAEPGSYPLLSPEKRLCIIFCFHYHLVAGATRLELATAGVTGRIETTIIQVFGR